jgi:toxin ParE1/3/4
MASFRLSLRADADLLGIGSYTLQTWGAQQANQYLGDLERGCAIVAQNPALGRSCERLGSGLRRWETGKHVLFYREERGGILVSRILHQSMLPARHQFDDDQT